MIITCCLFNFSFLSIGIHQGANKFEGQPTDLYSQLKRRGTRQGQPLGAAQEIIKNEHQKGGPGTPPPPPPKNNFVWNVRPC